MLIQFRVANHRSIREEQAITFEAAALGDDDDLRPRKLESHPTRLLPAAALYGANASGKSNALAALASMCDAVALSHRIWSPDGGVWRDPFAWGAARAETSLFEAEFILRGTRFQYGFVCDDDRFREEWLYAWPKGRKQVWFERDDTTFKFGEHLHGPNQLVREVTRPNALFLAAAVQLRHEQLYPVYRWFRSVRTHGHLGQRHVMPISDFAAAQALFGPGTTQPSLFGEAPTPSTTASAFLDLLRAADVGIVDVRVVADEDDASPMARRSERGKVLLRHQHQDTNAWLPLEEESHGTRALFRLGPDVLSTLATGGLLVIDELEASLHPLLGLQIVKLFNQRSSNPHHAQLLFSTHDTNLLGNTLDDAALRRDQVWLCEKDPAAATRIYPLTDYKPRKAENLERGYLQGRYGAIPFLGNLVRSDERTDHETP